ncbi:DUF5916 domain-containing protein [Novilysobacter erysipheiresistens]|uniref:DUF5916 domain-containing protein n=1 Tax=Novilysobacter erysipheiresistens TaxID=1749332 RepID=A0ABU7YUD1_9GAMM
MRLLPLIAILATLALPAHAVGDDAPAVDAPTVDTSGPAITVDGRIEPAEWEGARHITDFRLTQPLSGEPAPYATEAWVKSTPDGLAVAFRNTQPEGVPRTRTRTRRDEGGQLDRVNVIVDFDGDGRTGYDFMVTLADGIADEVITNETQFNNDWDGNWKHATSEDATGWSAEVLIPWYIAPMGKAEGGTRTIGLYLDRVLGSTGQRMSWPVASFMRPRFLSDFEKVELPAYSQSLLAVTPYVVGVYDNLSGDSDFDAGADIFWKPNGQTQLTATINPDFGQVESDDLVVNFGAEESFFSDKRPFFTENQGIFNFGLLIDNSQLIYTRRVGGAADDGSGPGDIDAAVKLNGSLGGLNYGVMAAEESGDAGRSFRALRLNHDFENQNVGLLATQVLRPFLDREARVVGIDHRWQPSDALTVTSNVVGSDIEQAGQTTRGSGATTVIDYEMGDGWRQQWLAMHFGDDLEVNDFGYLGRNNLNYGHWQLSRRLTDRPRDSAYASHDYRGRIIGIDNDDGLRVQRQLRLIRQSDRRDGGSEYLQLNLNAPGYEDLLTRGNNPLYRPGNFGLSWERIRPRKGAWAWELYTWVGSGGLEGNDEIGYSIEFEPTYYFSDALSAFVGGYAEYDPDWLVWQRDNLVGRFEQRSVQFNAGLDWSIGQRQELRVKLQTIGLDAQLTEAVQVGADGRAVAVAPTGANEVDDFSLRNLGFQVRYRYILAPLSDLYVVYGRGGYMLDEFSVDPQEQLVDSFRLRDSEQLLVKLSYRFEL